MSRTRRRGRTLSLRLWLILTVTAIVAGIALAELSLSLAMGAWQQQSDQSRLASVRAIIGADVSRWTNPTWQRHAEASLAALGVDVRLVRTQMGLPSSVVFVTAGARRLLDMSVPTTAEKGSQGHAAPAAVDMERVPHMPLEGPAFERIIIPEPTSLSAGRSAAGNSPRGAALLWFTGPAPSAPSPLLWPLAALAAILLVLAGVVWLLGRAVLHPLAAMSQAATGIAGGELDVHLPPSPVREIAEVSTALEGMSAALRDALARQSALAEERKLFIGAIAHDLRTPLFMLRGYLQGLESGVASTPEKMAHYIGVCRAKADALERLIADLFSYTRLEFLEQQPQCEPLELGRLLRQAIDGVEPLAASRGVALVTEAPDEPCALIGDSHLLARAVDNLLDNALRHTPADGCIRVSWRCEGAALRFSIEDSGPGIAEHDLPHLFTPLYRGEASRNRQTGGAGLGLSIAQRILRAHGGDLSAANAATGGAIFTATLPVPVASKTPLPA